MKKFRFTLEKYSGPGSRHACPNCGHRRSFSRYVDSHTGSYLHEEVGRCNREIKCGYHYSAWEYLRANGISLPPVAAPTQAPKAPKPPSYVNPSQVASSMRAYQRNNFAKFLSGILGREKAQALLERYRVGTSKYWPGAAVFWQVDMNGRVRTGKIMLYDPETGRRVKEPESRIHWAHRFLKDPHFRLSQCLFGEHLLRDEPDKPVAIVESEKTAVIASAFYPEYVWLACGGISQLGLEKCQPLKGREVTLIPDTDSFHVWAEKARGLEESLLTRVRVSRCLEDIATAEERGKGWDIADYLLAGGRQLNI